MRIRIGASTFTGNQTVNGKLSASGVVTGSGHQIGSIQPALHSRRKQVRLIPAVKSDSARLP